MTGVVYLVLSRGRYQFIPSPQLIFNEEVNNLSRKSRYILLSYFMKITK
jgi:hypothetical protein